MKRSKTSVIVAVALASMIQWTWRADEAPAIGGHLMTVDAATYALSLSAEPDRPCDDDRFVVRPSMGGPKVEKKMTGLIRCAIAEFGPVPGGLPEALRIAHCESGDHLWPWSLYYGSAGVFQQNTRYWQDRVDSFLRKRWFTNAEWKRLHLIPSGAYNPRANVIVSVRMANAGGWGPWSCA